VVGQQKRYRCGDSNWYGGGSGLPSDESAAFLRASDWLSSEQTYKGSLFLLAVLLVTPL